MKDLTKLFSQSYLPVKGLVIYSQEDNDQNCYVEAYDFSAHGRMINAHPLSENECKQLSEKLAAADHHASRFLEASGLLPKNLLYVRGGSSGYAVWTTPAMKVDLFFTRDLGLTDGSYPLPPLLWKADREHLWVYALASTKKLLPSTKLLRSPFFNVYNDGKVCMGDVDIEIDKNLGLEKFMQSWQSYFFNSKFSHVIGNTSPIEGNIIQFWQGLNNQKKFPVEFLLPHSQTIKNLIA